jgi:Heavy-metal resistance
MSSSSWRSGADEETTMIGCVLIGAAGLFMATRLLHRHHGCHGGGRWARTHWGGPGPDGYGGWDGPGSGGHGHHDGGPGPVWLRDRFGGGFLARALADRLDATPAQAKVIRDATDEFREAASKLKGEARKTRGDVAGAFRKGHFDAELFGELFARHDGAIEELRKAFVGMGAHIHDSLDERQRARLADLIEAGPGRWGRGWRRGGGDAAMSW